MKIALFITILLGIAIAIFSMDGSPAENTGTAIQPAASNANSVLERGLSNN